MGGGSRHSKNAGTMGCEGLNYHERKALHFGTVKERLGKDSVKDFDACGLTLTYAQDPVCTGEGIIFDREVILENLVKQKKAIARQLATWEAQQRELEAEETAKTAAQKEEELAKFHSQNHGAGKYEDVNEETEAGAPQEKGGVKTFGAGTEFERNQAKTMKAHWMPSHTPTAKNYLDKPDTATKCPCTGKPLRLKDLVTVKWTPCTQVADAKSMCPMCKSAFSNGSRIAVLKPTGDAVCDHCCKNFVLKDGEYNGTKMKKKDVIQLARGGNGFAAGGTQVESKRFEHLGVGSGLADIRGQSAGPRSAFGLRY